MQHTQANWKCLILDLYPLMEAHGQLNVVEVLKDKMIVDMHEEIKNLKVLGWLELTLPCSNNVIAQGSLEDTDWLPPHPWSSWGPVIDNPSRVHGERDLSVTLRI